jgi:hypothetical protein
VTTSAECNCDQSEAWKARALAAELENRRLSLSIQFARRDLEKLLAKVDQVLGGPDTEDVVTADHGVSGEARAARAGDSDRPMSPAVWQRVGSWMAERIAMPRKYSEQFRADEEASVRLTDLIADAKRGSR